MSKLVWTDVDAFVDGHDFSCDTNTLELMGSADAPECTTFCSGGWRERLGGLKDVSATMSGYWQAGTDTVDSVAWGGLTTAPTVASFSPDGTEDSTAFMFQPTETEYRLLGAVGDVAPFGLTTSGRSGEGLLSGTLTLAQQSITGDTNGTGSQLGALSATQSAYLGIHVFTAGTTATVILESDDNAGFTSATTRISQVVTATGGWWLSVAGAITDDYWRVRVSTVTGTFSIAAIQAIA